QERQGAERRHREDDDLAEGDVDGGAVAEHLPCRSAKASAERTACPPRLSARLKPSRYVEQPSRREPPHRIRIAAAPRRESPPVAVRPDGQAVARNRGLSRERVRDR